MNDNFIRDRAGIAHAQNKPFIIEETGMKVTLPAATLMPQVYRQICFKCSLQVDIPRIMGMPRGTAWQS